MDKKQVLANVIIEPEYSGLEIAPFLREVLGFSSRQLQKIIRTKGVLLNGRVAHSKTKLKVEDHLKITLPQAEQVKIQVASGNKLQILFEDSWFLGVEKPSGLPTYAIQGNHGLANQVAGYYHSLGQSLTPRPLHRLDTPTSGVVVFAKDAKTQSLMAELWNTGQVKRFYWALCEGQIHAPIEITTPIEKVPAHTRVEPLNFHDTFSELKVELMTGRTHQIRRHLSDLGHPLLGDRRYGQKKNTRLALHATEVSFPHPHIVGERIAIISPIPLGDFRSIIPQPL